MRFLYLVAAATAGWLLGVRSTRRTIDARFAALEAQLGLAHRPAAARAEAPALPVAPGGAAPALPVAPGGAAPALPVAPGGAAPAPAEKEEIAPEILSVIAAAVAAYLGKRARIRSVRRVAASGTSAWTQQGRVNIQGSHNLRP